MSTDDQRSIARELTLLEEKVAVADEVALIADGDLPATRSDGRAAARSGSGALLAAAMLGVGEIIEPQKTEVAIEQLVDGGDEEDSLLHQLDFGALPPLN